MIAGILVAVAFVGMWFGVLALLSQMSDWRKLAADYRAERPPSGTCLPLQGGKIGGVWYRGCLTIYASREGLYLSVWPIFRFREPPLFIPWTAIRNRREKRYLWSRLTQFEVGSPAVGTMLLTSKVFRDAPNV